MEYKALISLKYQRYASWQPKPFTRGILLLETGVTPQDVDERRHAFDPFLDHNRGQMSIAV
jgi:hypothetical protein